MKHWLTLQLLLCEVSPVICFNSMTLRVPEWSMKVHWRLFQCPASKDSFFRNETMYASLALFILFVIIAFFEAGCVIVVIRNLLVCFISGKEKKENVDINLHLITILASYNV